MLDFDPLAPVYPTTHIQDNDSFFRLRAMQADPVAYNHNHPPYSPHLPLVGGPPLKSPRTPPSSAFPSNLTPQSFNFDPFADEDSSTSSGASERERELEAQRLRRIEFLRRREWMRRVVAWVDGISHGMFPIEAVAPLMATPTLSPSSASSKSAPSPGPYKYTPPRDAADVPVLYYSSSSSLAGHSDEDDEPYVIYSTPLPGTAQPSLVSPSPSPSPSPPAPVVVPSAPVYTPAVPQPHIPPPPQAPSSRRIHGRVRSLSSIREEDEGVA
ncbi:hypothetical protein B0F90DRAFT_1818666 [Multifurca ochricompacta]|uniref:Uncharacterized protein n=1 Tax=Multifurca ochricompacta TaxID=376703 RepID=A0AAD4M277_9AGAM|nr:hypothetical protein B0F90DRAFT_1818666 [Multifurca ochricompacta]